MTPWQLRAFEPVLFVGRGVGKASPSPQGLTNLQSELADFLCPFRHPLFPTQVFPLRPENE